MKNLFEKIKRHKNIAILIACILCLLFPLSLRFAFQDKNKLYKQAELHEKNNEYIKANSYYKLADLFFYDKTPNYKKAISIYSYAIKNYPLPEKIELANYNIALSYQNLNLFSKAREEWRRLINSSQNTEYIIEAKLNLIKIAKIEGNFKERNNYLKEIISNKTIEETYPLYYVQAAIELSDDLKNQGKKNEAIEMLGNLLQTIQGDASISKIYYEIAKTYEDNYDYEKADQIYQKIIEIYEDTPYAPEAMLKIAKIKTKNKEYLSASEQLLKLINTYSASSPQLAKEAYCNLVNIFIHEKDIEKALKIAKNFYEKYPGDSKISEIKLDIANYYFISKFFNKAQTAYILFLQKYPRHPKADDILFKTGICFLNLKNLSKAWKYFNEIQKNYPDSIFAPDTIYIQAEYFLQQKNYLRAAYLFEKCFLTYPFFDQTNNAKQKCAYSYSQIQELKKAKDIYEDLINNEDSEVSINANEKIADIYFSEKKFNLSFENYEQIISRSIPENQKIEIASKMAESMIRLGNIKKAESICKTYIQKFPNNYKLYLKLADIYRSLKQFNLSNQYYEKYVSLNSIDSTNAAAYIDYADSLFYQKNFNKAFNLYDSIANINMLSSEKAWVLNQKAYLLMEMNKLNESEKTYTLLKSNYTNEIWGKSAQASIIYLDERKKINKFNERN
ncbi:MAG: tetratricopeptide repeat protein [Candidatus Firestonebacteria bacterium]|nr:tetratricopeptide repeat protein [Candidatus Firestonebacteria bacterium]